MSSMRHVDFVVFDKRINEKHKNHQMFMNEMIKLRDSLSQEKIELKGESIMSFDAIQTFATNLRPGGWLAVYVAENCMGEFQDTFLGRKRAIGSGITQAIVYLSKMPSTRDLVWAAERHKNVYFVTHAPSGTEVPDEVSRWVFVLDGGKFLPFIQAAYFGVFLQFYHWNVNELMAIKHKQLGPTYYTEEEAMAGHGL